MMQIELCSPALIPALHTRQLQQEALCPSLLWAGSCGPGRTCSCVNAPTRPFFTSIHYMSFIYLFIYLFVYLFNNLFFYFVFVSLSKPIAYVCVYLHDIVLYCIVLHSTCITVRTKRPHRSANADAEARLDIKARGFWNSTQDAYFDVRVFHPNAPCYRSRDLAAVYKQHESAKKREYNQRVLNVEHGVFTPLVFATTGSMAREASTFYKRLANLLSRKQEKPYSMVMGWLRFRLSFAILRSALLCVRGTRSSFGRPVSEEDLTLAFTEGQVPHENQYLLILSYIH